MNTNIYSSHKLYPSGTVPKALVERETVETFKHSFKDVNPPP